MFDLEPAKGGQFSAYQAGAHIDVRVGGGHVVRQYSLCGPPGESGRYRIAVLLANPSRGGSQAMHALTVGDRLDVAAPVQRFGLTDAQRHIMLAGGIGITPLLSMAQALDEMGGDYTLHYVARSREEAAFARELEGHPRVFLHFTGGDPARRPDPAHLLGAPDPDAAVYVCGPGGFIDRMITQATALGWPPTAMFKERFTAAAHPARGGADFTVRLASTGKQYPVPGDRSVLRVLRDNGVRVPYSCEQGICGECVVTALAGEPDHRDDVLTDDERAAGAFTLCVSRSRGRVLELDL